MTVSEGIEVVRFSGREPAIGYTDYSRVYISELVTDRAQYQTLHRHECGHIWLQHQLRGVRLRKDEGRTFDVRRWNISADLEIARHLYDSNDEAAICSPRSWLRGGICAEHVAQYPDCTYAEEYYFSMKEQPMMDADSHDGMANTATGEQIEDQDNNLTESIESLIKSATKLVAESVAAQNEIWRGIDVQADIKNFKPRPTLASDIDHRLGRPALARVRSYRRPSRRECISEMIKKGVTTVARTPKVSIYIDRSGSFTPVKTEAANIALNHILRKHRARIARDVWYFSDYVSSSELLGGGTNYVAVAKHIRDAAPELAIVLTDDDMCDPKAADILSGEKVIVIPVGAQATNLARILGAKELNY